MLQINRTYGQAAVPIKKITSFYEGDSNNLTTYM